MKRADLPVRCTPFVTYGDGCVYIEWHITHARFGCYSVAARVTFAESEAGTVDVGPLRLQRAWRELRDGWRRHVRRLKAAGW